MICVHVSSTLRMAFSSGQFENISNRYTKDRNYRKLLAFYWSHIINLTPEWDGEKIRRICILPNRRHIWRDILVALMKSQALQWMC